MCSVRPLFGEMIQIDWHFLRWVLQPPTRFPVFQGFCQDFGDSQGCWIPFFQEKTDPNSTPEKNLRQNGKAKSYGLRMTTAMVTIGLVYVAWRCSTLAGSSCC